jgi:aspartate racemase
MKIAGLIGGMSWNSSLEYYRIINEQIASRLGGLHSARCLLYSFDFEQIESLQRRAAWTEAAQLLARAGRSLVDAGADFLVICTNTMHKVADQIEAAVGVPLLHIADATADHIRAAGLQKVGLLATRFTMEEDFYIDRLSRRHDLSVLIPDEEGRATVHATIYDELCRGQIRDRSLQRFRAIITQLQAQGCQGIILGCTEIGLLVNPQDSPLPLFDTTRIHAEAAAELMLR